MTTIKVKVVFAWSPKVVTVEGTRVGSMDGDWAVRVSHINPHMESVYSIQKQASLIHAVE